MYRVVCLLVLVCNGVLSLECFGVSNMDVERCIVVENGKVLEQNTTKVAVLGEGAWGTAIALLLADNGCDVMLWCHDTTVADAIQKTGCNDRYLAGVNIPTSIKVTTQMSEALQNRDWVFETTPVMYLRTVLHLAKPYMHPGQTWVALSKGVEENTLLLPTQIIADVFGEDITVAACVGPSYAKELVQKYITAVTFAASDDGAESMLPALLINTYCCPYVSTDIIGIQVGAAFKNVIALGIGMLDGAGYGENTKAFLLSRGLQEIAELAAAMGGKKETVYGLSGVGDLVLTCMGSLSKNLKIGKLLGEGQALGNILQDMGGLSPEGINTVKSVHQLMQKYGISLPVCCGISDVIEGKSTVEGMLKALMRHDMAAAIAQYSIRE